MTPLDKESTKTLPRLSIVTPAYNMAGTIERTIQSVVEQDYPRVEYIVIDGGSTDGTIDIIKAYDGCIAYWTSAPDEGVYDAMNKGVAQASGELVGIINADDEYVVGAFEHIAKTAVAHPGAHVYYGDMTLEREGRPRVLRHSRKTVWSLADFIGGMPVLHPTAFIRRSAYARWGRYDTAYRIAADFDLMVRLVNEGARFKHAGRTIAHMRAGGLSAERMMLGKIESVQALWCHGAPWQVMVQAALDLLRTSLQQVALRAVEDHPLLHPLLASYRKAKDTLVEDLEAASGMERRVR